MRTEGKECQVPFYVVRPHKNEDNINRFLKVVS